MRASEHCSYDGRTVQFFESNGRLVQHGLYWRIQCPEYTNGTKMVIKARTVLASLIQVIQEIPPDERQKVTRIYVRPHQAVGLFLENILTAEQVRKAKYVEDRIVLGPLHIEGHTLSLYVQRTLPSNATVVVTDAQGKPLTNRIMR